MVNPLAGGPDHEAQLVQHLCTECGLEAAEARLIAGPMLGALLGAVNEISQGLHDYFRRMGSAGDQRAVSAKSWYDLAARLLPEMLGSELAARTLKENDTP